MPLDIMVIHAPGHDTREAIRRQAQALDDHRQAVVAREGDYKTSLLHTVEDEAGERFSLNGYSKISNIIQNATADGYIAFDNSRNTFSRASNIERIGEAGVGNENNQTDLLLSADGVIAAFGAIAGVVFVPIQMWIEHRQHQMERYKLTTYEQNSASEVAYESRKIKYANTIKVAKHKDETANKNSLSINRTNLRRLAITAPKSSVNLSVIRVVTRSNLGDEMNETYGSSYRLVRDHDGKLRVHKLNAEAPQQHSNVVTVRCDNIATACRIMIENDGSVKLKYLDRIHAAGSYNMLLPVENNRVHFVGAFEHYKPDEKKLRWTITDKGQWLNICRCLPIYSEMFRILDMPDDQRRYKAETVWPAQLVYLIMLLDYLSGNANAVDVVSEKPDISGIDHAAISWMIQQYRGAANTEGNYAMQFDVWTAGKYSLVI